MSDSPITTHVLDTALAPGDYQLRFAVGDYARQRGHDSFYPQVTIAFTIDRPTRTTTSR